MKSKWDKIVILLLFLIVGFGVGPQLVNDSASYMEFGETRGVLYPFFLAINRRLAVLFVIQSYIGEDGYLWLVVFEQNLLAGMAISSLYKEILASVNATDQILNTWKLYVRNFIVFLILCLPWIQNMVMEGSWISNTIYTEAIGFPLYYCLLNNLLRQKKTSNSKYAFFSIVCLGILMLIRKAFAFLIPCLMLIALIQKRRNIKELLLYYLQILGVCLIVFVGSVAYKNYIPNKSDELTHYDMNLLSNAMFFLTSEDCNTAEGIERNVIRYIYEKYSKEGYTYERAKKERTGLELAYFRSHYYDAASFSYIDKQYIYELIADKVGRNENIADERTESVEYARKILYTVENKIILRHWRQVIYMYFLRIVEGLIRTVGIDLYGYRALSMVVYVLLIGCMVYFRKNKFVIECSSIILLLTIGNCAEIGLFIFPAYRYVIMNSAPIYILVVYYVWLAVKKRNLLCCMQVESNGTLEERKNF